MRHAHDVRSDRVAAVFAAAVRDRLEDRERAPALGRERADRRLAPLERLGEPARALGAVEREPAVLLQRLADHAPMHERVLANVERGDMEAERVRAPQHAPYGEQSRVASLVRAQAVREQIEVRDELLGRLVRERGIGVGRVQARADEPQECAIRHLPMASGQGARRLLEVAGVELRLALELLGHADAAAALAQVPRELLGFAVVEVEHERALARERLADALRRDVRDCRPCRRRPSCRSARSAARARASPGTSPRARSRGSRRTAGSSDRARP